MKSKKKKKKKKEWKEMKKKLKERSWAHFMLMMKPWEEGVGVVE